MEQIKTTSLDPHQTYFIKQVIYLLKTSYQTPNLIIKELKRNNNITVSIYYKDINCDMHYCNHICSIYFGKGIETYCYVDVYQLGYNNQKKLREYINENYPSRIIEEADKDYVFYKALKDFFECHNINTLDSNIYIDIYDEICEIDPTLYDCDKPLRLSSTKAT